MSQIEIVQLKPDDYDDIIAVWSKAGLSMKPKGRDSRAELTRQMKLNPEWFIGARDGDRLVGAVIASHDTRRGYLNRIAVDPAYQGQGIAKLLNERAEQVLWAQGIKVITLLIEGHNRASRALALKLGYVEHEDIVYYSKRSSPED